MRLPHRLLLTPEQRGRLVDVARGQQPPDALLHAARMLNVYTGEVREAWLGIAEGRVAWAADGDAGHGAATMDLPDGVLVPGLIEPHCHPDIVYTPSALARQLTAHGTTTVCADTVFLSLRLDDDQLLRLMQAMSAASVKFLWNLRGCLDGMLPAELDRLGADRLSRLLAALPDVVATGEMTAWPQFLAGDERLNGLVDAAVARGLRVDGHAAGASTRTLGPLAAAGITADHEAITAEELLSRARLGYWLMLRHSSLRPDGRALAQAITSGDVPGTRVMLTTDGPVAVDLAEGHLDAVVRELLAAGVAPVDAVRMATLNPATYLGLDAHLGGIAPGQLADLVLVDSLSSFHPQLVLCEGVPVTPATAQAGFTDWDRLHTAPLLTADLDPQRLVAACHGGPTMRLQGVITRLEPASADLPTDASYAALIGRDGSWIVGGVIHGLTVTALASTFCGSGDVIVLGRDPDAVLAAYRSVLCVGGGIATHSHTLPLHALGSMYSGSVPELAAAMWKIADDLRLPAQLPPVEYLLLFLTIAVLPEVRLTPAGVIMVKTGEVLKAPIDLPASASTNRRAP